MKNVLRILLTCSILIVLSFSIYEIQREIDRREGEKKILKELMYLPTGKFLKVASLGFDTLVADVLWIKTVLYFGAHVEHHHHHHHGHRHHHQQIVAAEQSHHGNGSQKNYLIQEKRNVSPGSEYNFREDKRLFNLLYKNLGKERLGFLYPLLNLVTELDPVFIDPYTFGGVLLPMEAGDVDNAIQLLKKGMRYNPDRWEMPFYLGYNYLFYKNDRAKAFEYVKSAAKMPQSPPFVAGLAAAFCLEKGKDELAIEFLEGIKKIEKDEIVKERIDKKIRQLKKRMQGGV